MNVSPRNLCFDPLEPTSPFGSRTYNYQELSETPPATVYHTTKPITTTTNAETNKKKMIETRHSCLDLYTQPASSSYESSETHSSVSLWTPSYPSSASSNSGGVDDWIKESLSNIDVLAPTVPDLSFSFVPTTRSTSTVGNHASKNDHHHHQQDLLAVASGSATAGPEGLSTRSTSRDSSSRPSVLRSHLLQSPQVTNTSSKKSYNFLSNTGTHRCRNSSYLESQLDFLAQHQSPNLYNKTVVVGDTVTKEEPEQLGHPKEKHRRTPSSFLKLNHNQVNDTYHPRRSSASSLLDRALGFNSIKRHLNSPTSSDKSGTDPTLNNSSPPPPPPRPRFFFHFLSSKLNK